MATFFATLVYELDPKTDPDARKLLRAEMVGRRWQDKIDGRPLPATALFMRRAAPAEDTTDDVHRACGLDLQSAVDSVRKMGVSIELRRAWVQVTGAGTYGLVTVARQ